MNELEQRLIELEIRLTHQERMIEELNEVILTDNRRIGDLESRLQSWQKFLDSLGPELLASPDE
jgi:SlyX protein